MTRPPSPRSRCPSGFSRRTCSSCSKVRTRQVQSRGCRPVTSPERLVFVSFLQCIHLLGVTSPDERAPHGRAAGHLHRRPDTSLNPIAPVDRWRPLSPRCPVALSLTKELGALESSGKECVFHVHPSSAAVKLPRRGMGGEGDTSHLGHKSLLSRLFLRAGQQPLRPLSPRAWLGCCSSAPGSLGPCLTPNPVGSPSAPSNVNLTPPPPLHSSSRSLSL